MNNSCEFFGGGYCMCNTCQAVRKAMEEAEKITGEEIDEIFREAEKIMKGCDKWIKTRYF